MNIEGLKEFCADKSDDLRAKFAVPFTYGLGAHAVATDGRLLIRIPCDASDLPQLEGGTNTVLRAVEAIDFAQLRPLEDVFKRTTLDRSCLYCRGHGKVRDTTPCAHCKGSGEVTCSNDFCSGHDCCVCNGSGDIEHGPERQCINCEGGGKMIEFRPDKWPQRYGLAIKYYSHLAALPNCRVAPAIGEGQWLFVFDGGDGMVMGVRPSEKH